MRVTGKELGDKVSALRKVRGFTQAELAEKAGISIRTVQRIESNQVQPYDDTLKKIATAAEVELEELKQADIPARIMIMIHLSPLSGFIIPFLQILAPLILWFFFRTGYTDIDQQVKEIILFHGMTTLLFTAGLYF